MPVPENPAQLRRAAESILNQCLPFLKPLDQASHLAFRTASAAELAKMLELAACLGNVLQDAQPTRTYFWVVLTQPIKIDGREVKAFEFPHPKKDEDRPSGFYACVYVPPWVSSSKAVAMDKTIGNDIVLRSLPYAPEFLAQHLKAA